MDEQSGPTSRPATRCSCHRAELALGDASGVGVDAPSPHREAQAQAEERRQRHGHKRCDIAALREECEAAQGLPGRHALSTRKRFSLVEAAEPAAAALAAAIIAAKARAAAATAAHGAAGYDDAAAHAAANGADGRRGSLEASSLVAIVGRFALDAAREARAAAP